MDRKFYMAGVKGAPRADMASGCPYWLLSVTHIQTRQGIPNWLKPYTSKSIRWDPGTFAEGAISYEKYLDWIDNEVLPHHDYLQYDIVGDPEATTSRLVDMRRRGYNPIPILQPGGDVKTLEEPRSAIGGIARRTFIQKVDYLDQLFYKSGITPGGMIHLLGVTDVRIFERYPATDGDSTSWLPRRPPDQLKPVTDYGDHHIILKKPEMIQPCF